MSNVQRLSCVNLCVLRAEGDKDEDQLKPYSTDLQYMQASHRLPSSSLEPDPLFPSSVPVHTTKSGISNTGRFRTVISDGFGLACVCVVQDQFALMVVLMKTARVRKQKEDKMGLGKSHNIYPMPLR